jgi:ubiquitin carboxyl-terminal hydrolase L3
MTAEQLSTALEDSPELETHYTKAAMQGDSSVPESAEDEVDFHYITFVKKSDGAVYELDGDRTGPVERGQGKASEDVWDGGLDAVKEYINREGENVSFSLMALVGPSI